MKKALMVAFVAILGLMAMGCGSELHNTPASYVTLEVVNFPVEDGDIDWRGAFANDAWSSADKRLITVTGGTGAYDGDAEMIIDGSFQFTLAVGSSWTRTWMPATAGNELDYGTYSNFLVSIPMDGAVHTIKIDGSTNPAKLFVDDAEVSNEQKDAK